MSGHKDVNPHDFAEGFKNAIDGVILDVRTPAEFGSGHLPGALNMDFNAWDFREQLETLDVNREYFVYCHAGGRSAMACKVMQTMGFTHTVNMLGGITAWNGDTV